MDESLCLFSPFKFFFWKMLHLFNPECLYHPLIQQTRPPPTHPCYRDATDTIPTRTDSTTMPATKAPFRFFALPPELRIKIYEDVLRFRKSSKDGNEISRHSQILRASKKCYSECQPILQRLNTVQIKVSAFTPIDPSPDEDTFPQISIIFPGCFERSLWSALDDLPMFAGTCYDVQQRWQHALQSGGGGGGKLSVSLELSYNSIPHDVIQKTHNENIELNRLGVSFDGLCDASLLAF
jgi:hypothetical protein